jgi:Tol biopolymer transport system component
MGFFTFLNASCAKAEHEQPPVAKVMLVDVHKLKGKIVYVSDEIIREPPNTMNPKSTWLLHIVNANGTEDRKLLHEVFTSIKWHKPRKEILLEIYEKGSKNLYFKLYDLKEGKLRYALPRNFPLEFQNYGGISFSPDGKRVAGSENREGRISIVDLTGKQQSIYVEGGAGREPSWSPDGKKIAFTGCLDGFCNSSEIFIVNSDGSGVRQLTHLPRAERSDERSKVTEMISPWTRKEELDEKGGLKYWQASYAPRWSPDSKKIVFSNPLGIYTMNADGADLRQIVKGGACEYPVWSPDGTKLMYVCLRGGGGEKVPFLGAVKNYKSPVSNIYVCNADGTGEAQVTHNTYPSDDHTAPLNVKIMRFDWAE